ncbi:MAG: RagB/SusD family nutrient uptake outer membrane protein [Rikenellaceae bacterium]
MKKKNIFFSVLAASLLFTTSCESVFDYEIEDRVEYEDVFDDYYLTRNYVATCYSYKPNFASSSVQSTFLATFTDETQFVDSDQGHNVYSYYRGEMTSSNIYINSSLYANMYEGIKHCNKLIAHIDEVPYFYIEAYRARWKGEVMILRAYYFWQLVKRYGPMPIIKEEIPVDYDFSQLVRPTMEECVDAIVEDCRAGMAEEGVIWRIVSSDESKAMTKATAYAIMSEATLFGASPLWNPNNDADLWKKAYDVNKEALEQITANGYEIYDYTSGGLTGSYGPYQDYFLQGVEYISSPRNKEGILMSNISFTDLWKTYGIPVNKDMGVTGTGMSPSQELVDAYETVDGVPILNLENPYLDDNHTQPNYNPEALVENGGMYDPNNPYENRDQRLRSTIYVNGDYHNQEKNTTLVETFVGGNCGLLETGGQYTRTGYYMRKFLNWNSSTTNEAAGSWSIFRLAEIYLNFAEAALESNGATDEAYEAVNIIRRRAGQPDLPIGLTTDEFRLRLRAERRVEFAFEEHRYFDTRRWMTNQDSEGVVTGMRIEKQDDGSFMYNRFVVQNRNVTDDKYRLWPLTLTEQLKLERLGVYLQNTGW